MTDKEKLKKIEGLVLALQQIQDVDCCVYDFWNAVSKVIKEILETIEE